jgi:hypothetical protein
MTTLALLRPTEWELPLFFHVLGAMVMTGATLLALTALAASWRADDAGALRLGYRALLLGALPGWLVMRVFAQFTLEESPWADDEPGWIVVGFITSEPGLLLLVIATVLAGISSRRAAGGTRARAAVVLTAISLAMYAVTVWAMTTKPD